MDGSCSGVQTTPGIVGQGVVLKYKESYPGILSTKTVGLTV